MISRQRIDEILDRFEAPSDSDNLKSSYSKMTSVLRNEPLKIHNYAGLFDEIFETDKAKIIVNKYDCYFANNDDELSDFGAIVLSVNIIRDLKQISYEVELLIISDCESPKTVRFNSLELGSSHWIENLGTQYLYKEGKNWIIKNIIKKMSKYAPVTETYLYSGWAIDKQDTYIMEGEELCAKKIMKN